MRAGTGWSTMVPNYRPSDIIDNVRRLLDGEEMLPMTPWYRGFQGSIERSGKHRFKVRGCAEKVNSTTLMITELPVGTWTNNYTDFLTRCVEEKRIDGFSNRSSDTQVCFEVKLSRKMMRAAEDQGLETCLKLESSLLTSEPLARSETNGLSFYHGHVLFAGNMHLHTADGKIARFEQPTEIIQEFFSLRLEYYHQRKVSLLSDASSKLLKLDNKVRPSEPACRAPPV